jgi:hypothetical protein
MKDLGSNPASLNERQTNNCLSHGLMKPQRSGRNYKKEEMEIFSLNV